MSKFNFAWTFSISERRALSMYTGFRHLSYTLFSIGCLIIIYYQPYRNLILELNGTETYECIRANKSAFFAFFFMLYSYIAYLMAERYHKRILEHRRQIFRRRYFRA